MRLVDFLISLLEAHAQTLQRLAALFGEEGLIEILESQPDPPPPLDPLQMDPNWFEEARGGSQAQAYSQLESAVHDFGLPEFMEFYVWAYPHYRAFIESSLPLTSKIQSTQSDAGLILVDGAVTSAQKWIRELHLAPDLGKRAESASHVAWLRFRTDVLKKIGRRPLGPVIEWGCRQPQ